MNILIVKLSSIGDIVHALPSVAAVRRAIPEAHISWVAEARSAEILRGSATLDDGRLLIDELIEIDTRSMRGGKVIDEIVLEMGRQAKLVRSRKYDIAIDMQGLLKSAAMARISGADRRWGFDKNALREPASRFLLTDTVAIEPQTHIIDKNIRLAAVAFDFDVDKATLEFPLATNDEHVAEADAITELAGERFALLNPAGGWVTKLWHAEKFGELATRIHDELGITPVVVTAPNEFELAENVHRHTTDRTIFAEPSLKGFYEIAKRAAVYVGGDTGPTHLAVAANAPIVGIFGPTEWWRNGSPRPDDLVVERTDIGCRVDCHRRTCSNWICMDIDVETVFDAVKRRLGSGI
ncbi:MAG TPA: lipopolysaccharide heptosyltransferase I [Pyrinomonadaceae bacterium]|nr:lipopolysaccharide heptosyltransferase I [Pyrinomonadaceae bacterium]